MSTLKQRISKRVPSYLLMVGMAVLVVRYLQRGPADVTVAYQLGAAAPRVSRLDLTYRRGTEVFARASYGFKTRTTPAELAHRVTLPIGDYEVDIDLVSRPAITPRAGHPSGLQRLTRAQSQPSTGSQSLPMSTRSKRLRRPLLVRGSGMVSIFIDEAF